MKLSAKTHERILELIEEGLLSDGQIAQKVGCSGRTVWQKRRELESKIAKELHDEFDIKPPVYRGGGEW